jgi:hypothetical protein
MPGPRTACLFCSWSDLSHRVPAHILTHHIDRIELRPVQPPHCLNGIVKKGKEEMDFSVCLTCKKGTAHHSSEGHGQRWVSLHAKKSECRTAHAAAFKVFNDRQIAAKAAAASSLEDPGKPTTAVSALWAECKSNRHMAPTVAEIEARILEISEEFDDDPCFTPEEGFKQAIYDAIKSKKDVDEKQQEMNELVIKHDKEIGELRSTLREQEARVRSLEANRKDQAYALAVQQERMEALQREFEAYKKMHP